MATKLREREIRLLILGTCYFKSRSLNQKTKGRVWRNGAPICVLYKKALENGCPSQPRNSKQGIFSAAGNRGVMRVRDRHGVTYEFVASERIGGRRSLTQDWITFAAAKKLEVDAMLRIYWSGDDNEYVVQEGVQLFGPHIAWLTL